MAKAITACEEGAQWLWALNLLTIFQDQDLLFPTVHLGSGIQLYNYSMTDPCIYGLFTYIFYHQKINLYM